MLSCLHLQQRSRSGCLLSESRSAKRFLDVLSVSLESGHPVSDSGCLSNPDVYRYRSKKNQDSIDLDLYMSRLRIMAGTRDTGALGKHPRMGKESQQTGGGE